MAKTRLKVVYKKAKPYIICDTNVWYAMGAKKFLKPKVFDLIPTSLSLEEIVSSQAMVEEPKFYQDTIRMIYDNCGPIIPENPFDYVLQNQYGDYKPNKNNISKVLNSFGELMEKDIKSDSKIDAKTKQKIIEECQKQRGVTNDFAEIGNNDLLILRKRINTGIGKKKHLEIDTTKINREMVKSLMNHYTNKNDYKIKWDKFDWTRVELFMIVTEIYFKKLETTKGMKMKSNDMVDWLNLLYVSPDDKYLTFDDRWRNFILNDPRVKHYFYQ